MHTVALPAVRRRSRPPWWAVITVSAVLGITTGVVIGWATHHPPAAPRATLAPIPAAPSRLVDLPAQTISTPKTQVAQTRARRADAVITTTPREAPPAVPVQKTTQAPSQPAPDPPATPGPPTASGTDNPTVPPPAVEEPPASGTLDPEQPAEPTPGVPPTDNPAAEVPA